MLTKRQKQILDYIEKFIQKNEYAPSLEEIKEHFNLSSISGIHQHIEALRVKGYLDKSSHGHRNIKLTNNEKSDLVEIPLFGTIAAGEPIEVGKQRNYCYSKKQTPEIRRTLCSPSTGR